ncbi:MAG: 50S ribosomal protein L15 [Simkania sp.]|nr:50S ribosomal protein L15 [Simkania sp.]
MITLSTLKDTTRTRRNVQRVGRGIGSNRGKTCRRGNKGDKARSGYKRRYGYEGGQMPLYRKLPIRGFANGRFRTDVAAINLGLIDKLFKDGEVVNAQTLIEKNILNRKTSKSFKILAGGKLQKKVKFDVALLSERAREELEKGSFLLKN